jgi:flagellar hook-associated protein 1 FlgK
MAYTQAIKEEMQATRDNISAVSLDEEMTNLIKYQHAYMAAAKLITTAQEMLDEILKSV